MRQSVPYFARGFEFEPTRPMASCPRLIIVEGVARVVEALRLRLCGSEWCKRRMCAPLARCAISPVSHRREERVGVP